MGVMVFLQLYQVLQMYMLAVEVEVLRFRVWLD
jgi:hypothetical protein